MERENNEDELLILMSLEGENQHQDPPYLFSVNRCCVQWAGTRALPLPQTGLPKFSFLQHQHQRMKLSPLCTEERAF